MRGPSPARRTSSAGVAGPHAPARSTTSDEAAGARHARCRADPGLAVSVAIAAVLFLVASGVVAGVAPRLERTAGRLAQRTGLSRSIAGAVLLGASTSLPGIIVTVSATLRGDVELAAANAVGGVAAQTVFLAVADIAYKQGSLTRAALSSRNLTQLGLLLALLAVPLIAAGGYPDALVLDRVHPASIVLLLGYGVGLWVARRQPGAPDQGDEPGDAPGAPEVGERSLPGLWLRYAGYATAVGVAGLVISLSVGPLADAIGLSSVAAGALLTASATSSPELLTALSAARRGRPQLAVGDIVGGNTFDILFLAVADLALGGSLYAQVGSSFVLLLGVAVLLSSLLLLAFVRERTEHRVSPLSAALLATYAALIVLLLATPPG